MKLNFYVYVGKPGQPFKRTVSVMRDSGLSAAQCKATLVSIATQHRTSIAVGIEADSWTAADHKLRAQFPNAKLAPLSEHRRRATVNPDARTSSAAATQLEQKATLVFKAADRVGSLPAASHAHLIRLFESAVANDAPGMRTAARAVLADPAIKRKRTMHAPFDRALTLLADVLKRTPNPKCGRDGHSGARVKRKAKLLVAKKKPARKRAKRNPGAPSNAGRAQGSQTSAQLEAGARTFKKWNAFPPDRVETINADRAIPKVLVKLGTIPEIVYDSDKWSGKKETYVHKTARGNQPVLCTDPAGKRLFIVGGGVRVTRRGLIG